MLHADMLVAPQALGVARSLTLQAMAQGIPVVAQIDPWLDYLIDGQTARLLDHPDADHWRKVLCELLADLEQLQFISRRSREWIDEYHVPALQVQETISVYRQLSGESIPFSAEVGN
jgi:glycosyltransferase involved in cell wall biosynthesis